MALDFDKDAARGNDMLRMLSEELKISGDKAGSILRAVLYAVRSKISIDESFQVIAQLPMALKAVYVDEWDPWHSFHRMQHLDQFIAELHKFDKSSAEYDLGNAESAKRAVRAVFFTLKHYLSDGGFRDIIAVLPLEIKKFITGSIEHETSY